MTTDYVCGDLALMRHCISKPLHAYVWVISEQRNDSLPFSEQNSQFFPVSHYLVQAILSNSHAYVCVLMHVGIYESGGQRVISGPVLPRLFTLFFWDRVFHWPEAQVLGKVDQRVQESESLCLLSVGITSACLCAWLLFTWVLVTELRSSGFHIKRFTKEPSLMPHFWVSCDQCGCVCADYVTLQVPKCFMFSLGNTVACHLTAICILGQSSIWVQTNWWQSLLSVLSYINIH